MAGTAARTPLADIAAISHTEVRFSPEYYATELDVYSLARKFKVSTEAMVNRLNVLGIRARD